MTDAPEKIWAWPDGPGTVAAFDVPRSNFIPYTRTDLCQRLKAMERERCARIVERAGHLALAVEIRAGGQDPTKFDKRAAYLRGLEDAGAAIRNACNCDLALDAIRALAKEKRK